MVVTYYFGMDDLRDVQEILMLKYAPHIFLALQ